MTANQKYRCVNCGIPCSALYRTYGQSVLKLTKCVSCKGIVDKYIEYDPVIVMIDLVLVSKEAQRHILYNTDFKAYWKLFIILTMLETYAVWRSDCLFSLAVNTICDINNNSTSNFTKLSIPIDISIPVAWQNSCSGWIQDSKGDETDLFIWEKDFYVQFISTFSGIVMFIITTHLLMTLIQSLTHKSRARVSCGLVLRAFALSASGGAFSVAVLVWGAAAHLRLHYALVAVYGFVVFGSVFGVVYETATYSAMAALVASNAVKCYTTFHMTPYLRAFVT